MLGLPRAVCAGEGTCVCSADLHQLKCRPYRLGVKLYRLGITSTDLSMSNAGIYRLGMSRPPTFIINPFPISKVGLNNYSILPVIHSTVYTCTYKTIIPTSIFTRTLKHQTVPRGVPPVGTVWCRVLLPMWSRCTYCAELIDFAPPM